jgi:hypothetical protein
MRGGPEGSPALVWAATGEALAAERADDEGWVALAAAQRGIQPSVTKPRPTIARRQQVWQEIDTTMTTLRAG